jgi:hypothetical protein
MKRTTSAALAVVTISSLAIGATAAGASVPAKANPQKVCDAIASAPETPKQELAAIRLAQSGKNPELTKALAAMEKAAQKAVKSKKSRATETDEYNANVGKVFEFGYDECSDVQVEAAVTADGITGVPATVDAGSVGFKVDNETTTSTFLGVIKVAADNTATAEEIVTELFSSEDEEPEGIEFVGGGGAEAGETGYVLADLESGRYIFITGSDEEGGENTSTQHVEFSVA